MPSLYGLFSLNFVDLVAVLACTQFLFFGYLTGKARGRYGIRAPAVSGHELFERAYRVQMNTLEQLVAFLPALFLAARYWPQAWVAAAGAVYLLGRVLYWRAYVSAPASRGLGFVLTVLPTMGLLAAAFVGAVTHRG